MAKAKKAVKFPAQIYVAKENDGKDDEFLLADPSPEGMQVENDEREVAIYELRKIVTVVNKTEIV